MMKFFEKKSVIKIDEDDLKDARLSSMDFADTSVKKRAFVDVLGARLAMKLLFSQKLQANNIYSLYTIHNVLEELDIADIYYQGIKIDVRLVFDKNEIFIPRKHYEYDLLPDMYLVLCIKDGLSSAEFLGFFEPKHLDRTNANKDFYFYEYDNLIKPEKLKSFLDNFKVEGSSVISEANLKNAETLFLSLVDKEITQKDKLSLYKQLATSFELREKAIEFENFEIISRAIAKTGTLLDDGTLEVVSGGGGEEIQPEFEIVEDAIVETITENAKEEPSTEIDNEFIDINSLPDFDSEKELEEIDAAIDNIYSEFEANKTKEESNSGLNGSIIAGGAIVAAAGLGLVAEMAKGTASAAVASAQTQGAIIAGTAGAASAAIELGSELLNNLPEIKNETTIDELPDFGDFTQNDSVDDEFLEFTQEDSDEQPNDQLHDLEADEDVDEIVEIEETPTAENGLPETETLDEIDEIDAFLASQELPEFEVQNEETEISDIDEAQIASEELPQSDESFESQEQPEFAPQEEEDDDDDEIFEQSNIDADSLPSFHDLVQKDAEENGSSDFEYLVQNSIDETVLPDFGHLIQDETEEAEETVMAEIEPNEFANLEIEDLPELEHNSELIENINNDEGIINENLAAFNLQENAPLEELQELKEVENTEKDVDENQEEVFSLDNFDFNLLGETSDAVDSEKDFLPLVNLEEETQVEEEPKIEEQYKKEEPANQISPDSDDFISQVDNFLDEMDLSEEQRLLLEKTLMEDEDEYPTQASTPELPSAIYPKEDGVEFVSAEDDEDEKDLLKALFEKEKIDNLPELPHNEEEYDESEDDETPSPTALSLKNKKMIIAASIAGVVLVSFVIGGSITSKQGNNVNSPNTATTTSAMADGQTSQPNDMTNMSQPDSQMAGQMSGQMDGTLGGQSVQSMPGEDQQAVASRDMGKAVSEAFSSDPVNASISKVAWEVPEDLAYNDSFRKYLQIAGKNLKLNLQNDLLLATEMAYSNKVIVDLKIGKDGSLQSENVVVSSGSKQIDKIVLQSVKDTLKYLKMPSSELSSGSVNATLIINF